MRLDYLNALFIHSHAFQSKIDTLVRFNLLDTNKFCQ